MNNFIRLASLPRCIPQIDIIEYPFWENKLIFSILSVFVCTSHKVLRYLWSISFLVLWKPN